MPWHYDDMGSKSFSFSNFKPISNFQRGAGVWGYEQNKLWWWIQMSEVFRFILKGCLQVCCSVQYNSHILHMAYENKSNCNQVIFKKHPNLNTYDVILDFIMRLYTALLNSPDLIGQWVLIHFL